MSMSDIRKKTIKGIQKGDVFKVLRTFTQQDVEDFAVISKDDNPIHYHPGFFQSKNMTGPICHGLLVASLLTEIGGQIGWLASGMDLRFKKPVHIGDTICCIFSIVHIKENLRAKAEVKFLNQHDETVLEATLTGILPNEKERGILNSLL